MEFEHVKHYLLGFFPMERVLFLCKVMKGSSHLCVIFDEPLIEVHQSEETPNSFNCLQLWPLQNCSYFFLIHLNPVMSNYHAKEVNFCGVEHALFGFDE